MEAPVLEALPNTIREPLWQLKHSIVRWLTDLGFTESFHVGLQKQLENVKPTIALDVGANDGGYAHLLRRVGYSGPICSFEPITEKVKMLQCRSGKDALWTILPYALGDRETKLSLNIMHEDVFSSFLSPNSFGQTAMGTAMMVTRTQQVAVHRADNILPGLFPQLQQHRFHLKIDTQGFDMCVIAGFGECMAYVESVQVELSLIAIYSGQSSYIETLKVLHELGFQPTCFYPIARNKELCLIEMDALFRRTWQ